MNLTATPVDSAHAFHGEGAFWDDARGVMRYVDMLRGDILTWDGAETTRVHVSDVAALIRGRRDGGYVVATERGFVLTDAGLTIDREIPVFADAGVRMNEGACDAVGRLYCGSMAYDARPGGGRLYRLDGDRSVHVVLDAVSIPNGLVWHPTADLAFHADTGEGTISTYDVDTEAGTWAGRRPFLTFETSTGLPDGTAMDEQGGLWVALWGGGAVHRYTLDGALDAVVSVAARNVTSCAFGGPDRTTLFITTSQQGLDEPEPDAGALFAVETPFSGAAVHTYAG